VWIADDMAYSEGMLVSPDVLREHCLPWYRKMGGICRERRSVDRRAGTGGILLPRRPVMGKR